MPDYVMCARNISKNAFGNEPGKTRFLLVPDGGLPAPDQAQPKKQWADAVLAAAMPPAGHAPEECGHILFFVHGYNNSQKTVMERHRKLKADLTRLQFRGAVISFDWPSADSALNYLEDRSDAKQTALLLTTDGIALFARYQQPDCPINVHLLAHSMGALVVREAIDDADDRRAIAATNWTVSQVLLIAADISRSSLARNESSSDGLFRHCVRLTNYSNTHDTVLALSNAKRVGVAPRAGRAGLPEDAPDKAVNVDCSGYWKTIPAGQPIIGSRSHSWHIGDPVWTQDLLLTMYGTDRRSMPTRKADNGRLHLQRP
jgi:esterase/lipase superfamily enzyme